MIIAYSYYLCIISKFVYEADKKQRTEDFRFVQEVQEIESINKHPFVSIKTSVRFNQDVRSFQSKREYVF